jgi:hypothetical protein
MFVHLFGTPNVHLESIKYIFDDGSSFEITFDQFANIIENIHNEDDPFNIIHEYGLTEN